MTIPCQCQVFRAISLNLPQIAHVENNEFRNQRRQDAARPPPRPRPRLACHGGNCHDGAVLRRLGPDFTGKRTIIWQQLHFDRPQELPRLRGRKTQPGLTPTLLPIC
jgi:hypothetical protein